MLERNQAIRWALLDVQHLRTLTGYLAAIASRRDDERLASFCQGWERRLARTETSTRRAVAAVADDPEAAIAPLDAGPGGTPARLGTLLGTIGEWVDNRAAKRGRPGPPGRPA